MQTVISDLSNLTPLMEQYFNIKKNFTDAILLFRLGDFYEMFAEDAKIASNILGITLTSRFKGDKAVPMCGVPYFSATTYINRLLKAGKKVAICEQVEEPETSGKLFAREVVRVLTPGTIVENELLSSAENNFLLAILQGGQDDFGLSWIDVSTGIFYIAETKLSFLKTLIKKINPSEVILPESVQVQKSDFLKSIFGDNAVFVTYKPDWYFSYEEAKDVLVKHFKVYSLDGFGCSGLKLAISCGGAVLSYLKESTKSSLENVTKINVYHTQDFLFVDEDTFTNLEIMQCKKTGGKEGSLLGVIDKTKTAFGFRLLKQVLQNPVISVEEITARQEAIEEFYNDDTLRENVQKYLSKFQDIERICAKLSMKRVSPENLISLRNSLQVIAQMKEVIKPGTLKAKRNSEIWQELDEIQPVINLITNAIEEENIYSSGRIIKRGFSSEIDNYYKLLEDTRKWLCKYQEEESTKTGIPNLKIGYNQVFGYYFEVSKTNLHKIPSYFKREQTLKNCERFTTNELKGYELKILGIEEKIKELERKIFDELLEELNKYLSAIQRQAYLLANVDLYQSLAQVAKEKGYVKPKIVNDLKLEIRSGRHPILESIMGNKFVPNDVDITPDKRFLLITGPNMAGKSTYIRQVALLVYLAQIGSFIPAKSACIGIIDKIFARTGADDEINSGRSTFMVEMTEVARILNNATERSLVILDELGRGTSTYDGLSLAWAVSEYIHDRIGSLVLFATHYHELTELEKILPRLKNMHTAIYEAGEEITFLYKIIEGFADRSYGVYVAKLSGIPTQVINRAKKILSKLENSSGKVDDKLLSHETPSNVRQNKLFPTIPPELLDKLNSIDYDRITPIEALNKLKELKDLFISYKRSI